MGYLLILATITTVALIVPGPVRDIRRGVASALEKRSYEHKAYAFVGRPQRHYWRNSLRGLRKLVAMAVIVLPLLISVGVALTFVGGK